MKKWYIFIFSCLIYLSGFTQNNIGHEMTHDNVTREYTVHIPTTFDTGQSLPLVINLHGFGGNSSSHMGYTQFNTISDTGNFIVVYPQGLVGTTLWGWTDTQWNAYYGTGTNDLTFLDTLIDRMYYDYNIDLTKVYSTGHSNGGYMSYMLACELSGRIAAIASVGGAMAYAQENNCNITHPMPIMQIHGTDDQTVTYNGSALNSSIPDLIDFWRNKNNCASDSILDSIPNTNLGDSCTAVIEDYYMCDSISNVVLIKVENGGHSWPGAVNVPSLGYTCQDFKASSEIWNFFNRYHLENPIIPEDEPIEEDTTTDAVSYQILERTIKSIPNPFKDKLQIQILATSSSYLKISIHDALGRLVYQNITFDEMLAIDTKEWKAGLYYVYVNGKMAQKVMKGE